MSVGYFVKRLGFSVLAIFVIVTLTFVLFRMLPADPTAMMIDPLSDPARREAMRERLGLNEPLLGQYVTYLQDLARFDLGTSFQNRYPVVQLVNRAFLNSLALALAVFILAFSFGSYFGAIAAWYRGSALERIVVNLGIFFRAAPPYFIGILLVLLFAIRLGWLPSSGMQSSYAITSLRETYLSWDFLRHLILPAVSGALYAVTTPLLITRNAMLDVREADYIQLARAKGLRERTTMLKHGYRNAILPLLAEGSQFFAYAIGGMVTIEVVFNWPGVGRLIVSALLLRDFPVAQGAFLYIGLLVIVSYWISDVLVGVMDPRAQSMDRVSR